MELKRLGFTCRSVEIGKIDVVESLSSKDMQHISAALSKCGLELIDNKKEILVERIKSTAIELINSDKPQRLNFSYYLSASLNHDYTYLANVFSELESNTIKDFIIAYRIKLAKDLIAYSGLNLTEISWKLNYSSVAHLSTQFKKITGVTPSSFKFSKVQLSEKCEL